MKITLCDKKIIGSIPTYEVFKERELWDLVQHWLETKNFEESVFVCFATYIDDYYEDIEDVESILVSSDWGVIQEYICSFYLPDDFKVVNGYLNRDLERFSIFEFGSYKDAFDYCLELKEGF